MLGEGPEGCGDRRRRTATPGTVHAGGRPIEVTWLTITDLGRQALAGM
jgi:hypothetical protein